MDFYGKPATEEMEKWIGTESFARHCGIEILRMDETGGVGRMPQKPFHFNPIKGVHGGALYSLADSIGGHAALVWGLHHLDKKLSELTCTTVNSSVSFLRPAKGTELTCYATYHKMGHTIAVVDISIHDYRDVEVFCGTFTFMYVDRKRFVK